MTKATTTTKLDQPAEGLLEVAAEKVVAES